MAATTHSLILPNEIWWIITQLLRSRLDHNGLYTLARVSHGLASLALPELYSIHSWSDAFDAHILALDKCVCLWRSVIASSLGETLFPYCSWINQFKLGNLHSLLEDLSKNNPALKAEFFKSPLDKFQIKGGRGTRGAALNLEAIVNQMADSVTEYIGANVRRAKLTTLEAFHLPSGNLVNWVSNLPRLTSLVVREGSVLTSEVAKALAENCGMLTEIECYSCKGEGIDAQMAGFFESLEPNTLESFTVLSANELGQKSFRALTHHSESLKFLTLQSLDRTAFDNLGELHSCLGILQLTLEASATAQSYQWESQSKTAFQKTIQWLRDCPELAELELTLVPNASTILAELLKNSSTQLTMLTVKLNELNDGVYWGLECQDELLYLTVKIANEDVLESDDDRHSFFTDVICSRPKLYGLDTNELLTLNDIIRICNHIPTLGSISLNGEFFDDEYLLPLSRLENLQSLQVFSPSGITATGLLAFLARLIGHGPGSHEYLEITIACQGWHHHFSEEDERIVTELIEDKFDGRFEMTYLQDPDARDYSDSDD
ncbi:hypothetical protein QBC35DRAFT_374401 [Podospora australis]|uniref:Uncharacterized protein n=1 Tax=Podospora australis TaxID=1536484 RepID=A0AAN6X2G6_9PEZI|nr:hypothetical protein QBC35DRAFT_374401 [Podospora australis]